MILLAPALAHVPHDAVTAIAAPSGAPWYLVANPGTSSLLLRSEDLGRTWGFVGGDPTADTLVGAAAMADGTVVLLGEARLWWGDGESWSSDLLPGRLDVITTDGEDLVLGGSDGVWAGAPDALTRELPVPVAAMDGAVALARDGRILRRGDGWVRVEGPGAVLRSVVAVGEDLLAGGDGGQVWRRSGSAWSSCAALPEAVTRIAEVEGALLATTATQGPYVSLDGCATWQDRGAPLDVDYAEEGAPTGDEQAFPVLLGAGGGVVVGGWAGLATSADQGLTWETPAVIPPDYTRGLAISHDFTADGTAWWGTYSAGIARTEDGGRTFSAVDDGSPNVQDLQVSPDGTLYAIVAHELRRSDDGGASWQALHTPFVYDIGIFLFRDVARIWASGRTRPTDPPIVAESVDGGATWSVLDGLEAVRGITRVGDRTCVVAGAADVSCRDDGDDWTPRFTGEGEVSAPVGWPAEDATRLLVADLAGVHRSDDGGASWELAVLEGEDAPEQLVIADDDTMFVATRSGYLWRSTDGGEAWRRILRLTSTPRVLAPRPGFASLPEMLVAAADGVWAVLDARGEATLHRWGGWQRILASRAEFVRCEGCPTRDRGVGQPLAEGAVLSAWVRGETVRVDASGRGPALLRVDGVEISGLQADGTMNAIGLGPGWHEVEIEGEDVAVEAIEASSASIALDWTPGSRCGGGAGFVVVAGLWRRRWGRVTPGRGAGTPRPPR